MFRIILTSFANRSSFSRNSNSSSCFLENDFCLHSHVVFNKVFISGMRFIYRNFFFFFTWQNFFFFFCLNFAYVWEAKGYLRENWNQQTKFNFQWNLLRLFTQKRSWQFNEYNTSALNRDSTYYTNKYPQLIRCVTVRVFSGYMHWAGCSNLVDTIQ